MEDAYRTFERGTPAGNLLYKLYNKKTVESTLDRELLSRLQAQRRIREAKEQPKIKPTPKSKAHVNVPRPSYRRSDGELDTYRRMGPLRGGKKGVVVMQQELKLRQAELEVERPPARKLIGDKEKERFAIKQSGLELPSADCLPPIAAPRVVRPSKSDKRRKAIKKLESEFDSLNLELEQNQTILQQMTLKPARSRKQEAGLRSTVADITTHMRRIDELIKEEEAILRFDEDVHGVEISLTETPSGLVIRRNGEELGKITQNGEVIIRSNEIELTNDVTVAVGGKETEWREVIENIRTYLRDKRIEVVSWGSPRRWQYKSCTEEGGWLWQNIHRQPLVQEKLKRDPMPPVLIPGPRNQRSYHSPPVAPTAGIQPPQEPPSGVVVEEASYQSVGSLNNNSTVLVAAPPPSPLSPPIKAIPDYRLLPPRVVSSSLPKKKKKGASLLTVPDPNWWLHVNPDNAKLDQTFSHFQKVQPQNPYLPRMSFQSPYLNTLPLPYDENEDSYPLHDNIYLYPTDG